MEIHLLAPGVQDQAQDQVAAQAVAPKFQEAVRGAVEEKRLKLHRVEQQQRVEFAGQREDAVIIGKPCVCPQVLHGSMRLTGRNSL